MGKGAKDCIKVNTLGNSLEGLMGYCCLRGIVGGIQKIGGLSLQMDESKQFQGKERLPTNIQLETEHSSSRDW